MRKEREESDPISMRSLIECVVDLCIQFGKGKVCGLCYFYYFYQAILLHRL